MTYANPPLTWHQRSAPGQRRRSPQAHARNVLSVQGNRSACERGVPGRVRVEGWAGCSDPAQREAGPGGQNGRFVVAQAFAPQFSLQTVGAWF
jgi:hypothetical protein